MRAWRRGRGRAARRQHPATMAYGNASASIAIMGKDPIMSITRPRLVALLSALLLASALAACGDTWRGAKEDTGENLEATGQALDEAGEKVES